VFVFRDGRFAIAIRYGGDIAMISENPFIKKSKFGHRLLIFGAVFQNGKTCRGVFRNTFRRMMARSKY
jgi:hypothetical protein